MLITFYLNGGQAWMTCLTLKMTEKFTGCQEYQPRLELWVFRKKRRHSQGLYIRVFLLGMQKDEAIISTWTLIAVLYYFISSKQINWGLAQLWVCVTLVLMFENINWIPRTRWNPAKQDACDLFQLNIMHCE